MAVPGSALPYRLRLGVTGHRALHDEPAIAGAVRRLLDQLEAILGRQAQPPVEWIVVSPLAKGADRIVAQAALARAGTRLEVVMPLPAAEYRRDFLEPTDIEAFDQLLTRADVVEEPDMAPVSDPAGPERKAARAHAYLRVGQQVVDSCEILIAVWNGRPGTGVGGTADIVRYALSQDRTVIWINAEAPAEPTKLLRSVSFPDRGSGAKARVVTAPLPQTATALSASYHQHASFFKDDSLEPAQLEAAYAAESRRLAEAARQAGLQTASLQPFLAHFLPYFVRADLLARHYQRRHALSLQGVLYLGALAITLGVARAVFFPDRRWLTGLEVLAMTALLLLWLLGRRREWHVKWLNSRCLAEQLRSALFTRVAGPAAAAPSDRETLPFYRGPSHWIAGIADQLSRGVVQSPADSGQLGALKRFLAEAWIDHQIRFNLQTAERKAAVARSRHRLEFGLIGTTFLMSCLHWAGAAHGDSGLPAVLRPESWITFLAMVLLPWAGAAHAVTSQLELERIGERAKRMARNLDRLRPRLAGALTGEELARVAREAAELMTHETHEWWVLLSFQEARLHA